LFIASAQNTLAKKANVAIVAVRAPSGRAPQGALDTADPINFVDNLTGAL